MQLCLSVVHLTTVHSPLDVRIFHKQAVSLARHGYDVSLLAPAQAPGTRDGVHLIPLPQYTRRIRRMTVGAWHAWRAARATNARVIHFHDPELILVGLLLKAGGRVVIYDAHEDVAKDLSDKAYLPAWSRAPIRVLVRLAEGAAARAFDAVVAATPAIGRRFPDRKTVVIRNLPIVDVNGAPPPVLPFRDRPRRVIYVGGLAPLNGVTQMLAGIAATPRESGIRLQLGGRFSSPAYEREMLARVAGGPVDWLGWVPREQVPGLMHHARAGLVLYQPTPNVMESEPNKFFEVLAAGLPLIVSDLPHWKRFVEEHGCGIAVDPTDPAAIAAAIVAVIDDPDQAEAMGRRGRELILSGYNWESESARLLSLYRRFECRSDGRSAPTPGVT